MSEFVRDDKMAAKFEEIATLLRMITRGKNEYNAAQGGRRVTIYAAIQSLYVDVDHLLRSATADLDKMHAIYPKEGTCGCEARYRTWRVHRPSDDVLKFIENNDRGLTK